MSRLTIKRLDEEIAVREQSHEVFKGAFIALSNRTKEEYLTPKVLSGIGNGIYLTSVIRNLQPFVATIFSVQDKQFRQETTNRFAKDVARRLSDEAVYLVKVGIDKIANKLKL